MPVSVAEYLGIRTDSTKVIQPISDLHTKPKLPCPFRNAHCLKTAKGQQPVCSVTDTRGQLWIVCEHRLCATTPKTALLNDHQKNMLHMVAKSVYGEDTEQSSILFKREEPIPITATSDYKADYIMWVDKPPKQSPFGSARACIVEMQGGGETSGTEKLTAHLKNWASKSHTDNEFIRTPANAGPLVTNAWRRQQEQFLVKGSVATLTGGRMVFCVGSLLYDYLIQRLTTTNLVDLKEHNWSLALLGFAVDNSATPPSCAPHSIQFKIDEQRSLFTNYFSFVQALTNQGMPQPKIFAGIYDRFDGTKSTF